MKLGMWEEGYILGGVTRKEGIRLARLASRVPDGQVIVELGTHNGASACWLALGVHHAGRRTPVYCVDLWDTVPPGPRKEQHAERAVWDMFQARVAFMASAGYIDPADIHPVRGDSVETGRSWDGPPVGLLHVDALHTLDAVRGDLDAWIPHLAPGAVVVLHDAADLRLGVRQAGRELARLPGWTLVGLHRGEWRRGRHGQMVLRAP